MRVKVSRVQGVEEIDVPRSPFAVISGATSLITTLVTVVTFWYVTKPNADQTRVIEMNRSRTEMLQRALQVETADGRRNSLRLLVGLGMIGEDRSADLDSLLKPQSDTLPLWRPTAAGRGGGERLQPRDTVRDSTATARR